MAASLKQIHSGYDKAIYTADGLKYSDAISVTIDSATLNGNTLDIKFKAAETPAIKNSVDVTKNMTPTVILGLYGWDTKDFVVGGHERLFDDNKDGTIDSNDQRTLEAVVGTDHPRIKTVSAKNGAWEVQADLSAWDKLIKDGTVSRVEVGVLPTTVDADGVQVAVDATTRTFDLGSKKFDDGAFSPIAETEKCENCHAALATNFHSPSYGGSVTACRMCHIVKSGASHLEMQSRSLDSYVHAIHSGQAFDVGDINFADPVEALHYEHHISMPYPTHAIKDCESCHAPGTYEVPNQSASLPGILSASDVNETWDRSIGAVPSVITGPAERACSSCHRATLINEDMAGELAILDKHNSQGGYEVPAGDDPVDTWTTITKGVMSLFK
jgi:OmcA/MtrC family decaheme c-type cytochrome